MINVHWMPRDKLMRLLYKDKLFVRGLFKRRECDFDDFQRVLSAGDLILGIKNKNLWVRNIKEI